jgi:hypothetical protein
MHESLTEMIVEFYLSLIIHENEELRKRATYNLPFFFSEFYSEDESESVESCEIDSKTHITQSQWKIYIETLAKDDYEQVRITLAGCFFEI